MNFLSYARWYFLPDLWMRLLEEEADFIAGLYVRRVPVHNAIATNKLSSATGTAVSTWHLVKSRCVDLFLVPGTVACAFVGSIAGANLALIISDKVLKTVLVFVLPVVAFCVLRDKNLKPVIPEGFTRKKQYLIMAACSFVIGIYDGFYGPGTGTFLLLTFTKLGKLDMEKATGNVKVVNLTSNISALITFVLAGKILWVLGLSASIFSIAGHYLGAHMVVKNGVKVIKTDYWDIHAMADAIYSLCTNPALFQYLQEEGKKEVDGITWEKVGLRIRALYEDVLRNYGK